MILKTIRGARGRGLRPGRVRPGGRFLLPVLLCWAALFLASTGCNFDRALAGDEPLGAGPSGGAALRDLSLEDLPADLNLTASQRTELAAALRGLQQDRSRTRGDWRDARRRDRGACPRDGLGPQRRGSRGDCRLRARARGTGEELPPMAAFLETASKTLDATQFERLVDFLKERRERLAPEPRWRPGPGPRRGAGPRSPAGPGWDREAPPSFHAGYLGLAARRLGLTPDQESALRPALDAYLEEMREVRREYETGALSAEQALDRAVAVRREAEARAESILTPEQRRQAQELRDLRRERASERRGEQIGRDCDRRVAFTTRVLGLDAAQAASVRKIYEASIPERRQVWDQVRAGALQPEEVVYAMGRVEERTNEQVRSLLTPDQLRRYDALKELLPGPRGPRR